MLSKVEAHLLLGSWKPARPTHGDIQSHVVVARSKIFLQILSTLGFTLM